MARTTEDAMRFMNEENVKFVRLEFCDIYGKQKYITIPPRELERALEGGIAADPSAVDGLSDEARADLFLRPDPGTLALLPWSPERRRTARMYCDAVLADGTPSPCCTRSILKTAVRHAEEAGISFRIGSGTEFYLFRGEEEGGRAKLPLDEAGYLEQDDRGEAVRQEITLALGELGLTPFSAHHEYGPGQNEIVFCGADPLAAADNAMTLRSAIRAVAAENGIRADLSPRPLENQPGSGFHIAISARGEEERDLLSPLIAGVLDHIRELTVFLNNNPGSYSRFGKNRAPRWISWCRENRSQLIRVPAARPGENPYAELRSPDPAANPYLAFAVLIEAALDGIRRDLTPPEETKLNLYTAPREVLSRLEPLPETFEEAAAVMKRSAFPASVLPQELTVLYGKNGVWEF